MERNWCLLFSWYKHVCSWWSWWWWWWWWRWLWWQWWWWWCCFLRQTCVFLMVSVEDKMGADHHWGVVLSHSAQPSASNPTSLSSWSNIIFTIKATGHKEITNNNHHNDKDHLERLFFSQEVQPSHHPFSFWLLTFSSWTIIIGKTNYWSPSSSSSSSSSLLI